MEKHRPVLRKEILHHIAPALSTEHALCIDATLGAGGHAKLILERFPTVSFVGIDADDSMLDIAGKELEQYMDRVTLYNMWFDDFFRIYPLEKQADVIFFDLGVSQWHYHQHEWGFSFDSEASPDMRLNRKGGVSADAILYRENEEELTRIFREYGEERFAGKIARAIIRARHHHATLSCKEIASIVRSQYPQKRKFRFPHPATRVFQALRIAVNAELDRLQGVIPYAFDALRREGRMAIISFHSLEDRIVKRTFRNLSKKPEAMTMSEMRGLKDGEILQKAKAIEITRKPIFASEEEAEESISRSARLRVLEKQL